MKRRKQRRRHGFTPADLTSLLQRFGVETVSEEEAEQARLVVCVPSEGPSSFPDDITTTCALCGVGIRHRPHVPKRPPTVWIRWAIKLTSSKKHERST